MRTNAAIGMAMAAMLALPSTVHAQDKRSCVSAYEKAQQLRSAEKLRAAREQLLMCSRPECPALVRKDCSTWMGDVESAIPSVVVAARDTSGHDLVSVRVSIDGAVVAETLDGKPILLDPGPHRFKYETAGKPPVEEQVIVREGEHHRPLTLTFVRGAERSESNADHAPPGDAGPPVAAYVPGAVGVVALGAALYLDLTAMSDARALRDSECKPNCSQDRIDAVQAKYVAAGVSLGVGLVGLGLTTVLLFTHSSAKTTAWRFDVGPMRGGAAASLGAAF